jgi:diguanylate cyclase (GGDEF)-like protein
MDADVTFMGLFRRVSSFMCRDEEELAWMLDMHLRIVPVMFRSMFLVLALMVMCLPWYDPVSFIPMAVAAAGFGLGSYLTRVHKRIDPLVYAWAAGTALIATATAINARHVGDDGAFVYALCGAVLIWPLVGVCGVIPSRLAALATAWCCLLVVVPGLVLFRDGVLAYPPAYLVMIAMLMAVPVISSAARRAGMEHRTAAVVDPLTGMLNRAALEARAAELAHQSSLTGERVGVIALDLDHFKTVNDTHGHAVGDRVLQEVAYRVRTELRAFDLAYRLGGEEFVVLLPGADDEAAERIGRELWSAIRCAPVSGLPITVSVGVAVSAPGEPFSFDTTFHTADAALYEAKAQGRDRVVARGMTAEPVAA